MPVAFSLARLTIKDIIRRRVFATLGIFALLMLLLSFPLRQLTIGEWTRLIVDVGLAATDLCVSLLAILVGATLVAGDLERRSLYPLLAKPFSRSSFVIGKYLGLTLVLFALVGLMTSGVVGVLVVAGQHNLPILSLFQTGLLLGMHACVCSGIVILFSCFTSTTLAGTFGLAVVFLGHTVDNLIFFAKKSESFEGRLVEGIAQLLPNLERLNLKTLAAHQEAVAWTDLGMRSIYGLAYSVTMVAFAAAIFTRRDLK